MHIAVHNLFNPLNRSAGTCLYKNIPLWDDQADSADLWDLSKSTHRVLLVNPDFGKES